MKIGERSGMGLSQLYGNWEEAGYARPQLSEAFNPERTRVEIEVEVAEKASKVAEKVAEKPGEYTENPSEYTEKPGEYTEKPVRLVDADNRECDPYAIPPGFIATTIAIHLGRRMG